MGNMGLFKKKKEGDLPPPPPPRSGELPPLPIKELDIPPAPEMPKASEMPEPLDLPDLEPLPEVPIVKDTPELEEPKVVEERIHPQAIVEDATLEKPAPKAQVEKPQKKPAYKPIIKKTPEELFVSVDEYGEMKDSLDTIQRSLEESEAMISRMSELKNAEEELLETWRGHLEDVEKKLSYVDQVIFEGE